MYLNSSSNGVESSTQALAEGHLRALRYTAYKRAFYPPSHSLRVFLGRSGPMLPLTPPLQPWTMMLRALPCTYSADRASHGGGKWPWSRQGAASTNWRVELTEDQAGPDEWNQASPGWPARKDPGSAVMSHRSPGIEAEVREKHQTHPHRRRVWRSKVTSLLNQG